jgi:hypothetical protein
MKIQILEVIDVILLIIIHVLLVRNLDASEDSHYLCNADEVYLVLLLLDVQDLLLYTDIQYANQLLLRQAFLIDC